MTYQEIAEEIAGMSPEQRQQQAGLQTEENDFIPIVSIGVSYNPDVEAGENVEQLVFVAEGGD